MKFSGSFTAFVVASVATANLAAAAPLPQNVGQVNTQNTSQNAAGTAVQTSNSDQDNKQALDYDRNDTFRVDYDQDNSNKVDVDQTEKNEYEENNTLNYSRPLNVDYKDDSTRVYAPKTTNLRPVKVVKDEAPSVVAGVQNNDLDRRSGAFGQQGASANGAGGTSSQGQVNVPVVSGAGNSITTGGAQGAENQGLGGTITQSLSQALQKRLLFAGGKQAATADGYGGTSGQGQVNVPVVSGAGNSITTGGAQGSQNNGQGGEITQKLLQELTGRGLGTMLGLNNAGGQAGGLQQAAAFPSFGGGSAPSLFAAGSQQAGANGFGGFSNQGQSNRPVLSGAGNSITAGGAQGADNSGKGGKIGQELLQKLGVQKRQFPGFGGQGGKSAFGSQGASANGQGGFSSQFQSNRPVVSGFGNSVTTGGAQGATNNGQGGSITQTLEQLLGRDVQAQGQGVGQGTYQYGDATAKGGNAFVAGANGPVVLDSSAVGGALKQESGSKQAADQSASQAASYSNQNNYATYPVHARAVQGQGQGIGQGTGQYGSASATGGSAFVVGANGPVYLKTSAQGGVVDQSSASQQDGQQSGTQGLSSTAQNNFAAYRPYFRREAQGALQGANQTTSQAASADAKAGDVAVIGDDRRPGWTFRYEPEFVYAPSKDAYKIDTSAKAGPVSQNSSSNQANKQYSGQDNKESTSNQVSQNRRELTEELVYDKVHTVRMMEFKQDEEHIVRKSKLDRRQFFQGQNGAANAFGGNSADYQVNGGFVDGTGKSFTSGGPQSSNNSGTGGQLSQLLNPAQQ